MLEFQALKLPHHLIAIRFKIANNKKFHAVPQLTGAQKLSSSYTGATWLLILSILILCVEPARFLDRDKKSGSQVKQAQ